MLGLCVELTLVVGTFLFLWRKQVRARQRARERASQLDFGFLREPDSRA